MATECAKILATALVVLILDQLEKRRRVPVKVLAEPIV